MCVCVCVCVILTAPVNAPPGLFNQNSHPVRYAHDIEAEQRAKVEEDNHMHQASDDYADNGDGSSHGEPDAWGNRCVCVCRCLHL